MASVDDTSRRKGGEVLTFRAPRDVVDAVIERAQAEDRSVSYVLRRMVEERLELEQAEESEP